MAIDIHTLSPEQVAFLLGQQEGHFFDFKSLEIKPAKLSKTLSAFANADGGEAFVGIRHEQSTGIAIWSGFSNVEDANGHLQGLEEQFSAGDDVEYNFLESKDHEGLVLQILVQKSSGIKLATNKTPYVRSGARSMPIKTPDEIKRLEYNKGVMSYQDETFDIDVNLAANSLVIIDFMLRVIPLAEPRDWLKKQLLIYKGKPRVVAILLFLDEPQTVIPKASVKIYRYDTDQAEGTRQSLAFDPIAIEGCIYNQIKDAVKRTVELIEKIRVYRGDDLVHVEYPMETIHEIITNAVIHRDYSINDDVHVRIFNNRVEIESPGLFPGHVTAENILSERFSRNDKIVRLLNKFPDAPNKDVGEGLNTAFEAMRQLRLKNPEIVQRENSVIVYIRHESLAGHEETILEFLKEKPEIGNSKGREICNINSESVMRKTFQKMITAGLIERVPEKRGRAAAYRLI